MNILSPFAKYLKLEEDALKKQLDPLSLKINVYSLLAIMVLLSDRSIVTMEVAKYAVIVTPSIRSSSVVTVSTLSTVVLSKLVFKSRKDVPSTPLNYLASGAQKSSAKPAYQK
jgi:hypothetical protein